MNTTNVPTTVASLFRLVVLPICGLVVFLPSPCNAIGTIDTSDVVFAFRGTIESIEGSIATQIQSVFDIGDSIEGTYSFNPNSTDARFDDPELGAYIGAVKEISVHFDGDLIASRDPLGEYNDIVVWDYAFDKYQATIDVEGLIAESLFVDQVEIGLFSSDNSVFSSDELPLIPPPLSSFSKTFGISYLFVSDETGRTGFVFFSLDSLTVVPEPQSAVLVAVAGVGVTMMRRRRYQSGKA